MKCFMFVLLFSLDRDPIGCFDLYSQCLTHFLVVYLQMSMTYPPTPLPTSSLDNHAANVNVRLNLLRYNSVNYSVYKASDPDAVGIATKCA